MTTIPSDTPANSLLETQVYRDLIDQGQAILAKEPTPQAAAAASTSLAFGTPPNWPSGIPVVAKVYANWALSILAPSVWIATPANEADCVTIANWAVQNGYTMRASGAQHSFSPLVVPNGAPYRGKTILVNTSMLKGMVFQSGTPATATFGVGVTVDDATQMLQGANYGFLNYPAPGILTIGGVLAIGGHGTGGFQDAEKLNGCLSNLILSFRAIVTDGTTNTYTVKTFNRSDPDADVMILHIGRAFITEVTVQVVPNYYLQVKNSYPDDTVLFGTGTGTGSFQQLVQEYGRVEVIAFPFTTTPWVKCWQIEQTAIPPQTTGPYNYPLANDIQLWMSLAIAAGLFAAPATTPLFNQVNLATTKAVIAPVSTVLNGPSRDLLLYVKDTTLRVTAIGYAWQCKQSDIQSIVSAWYSYYNGQLETLKAQGQYPMNAPTEIRCTTMDYQNDLPAGSLPPALSICRPADPSLDTVLWIQSLTIAGTKGSYEFMESLEQWFITNWGPNSTAKNLRPEWSKGWAFTADGPGTNTDVIQNVIPALFNQPDSGTWDRAKSTFAKYDAARIYTDPLLDLLFPA